MCVGGGGGVDPLIGKLWLTAVFFGGVLTC